MNSINGTGGVAGAWSPLSTAHTRHAGRSVANASASEATRTGSAGRTELQGRFGRLGTTGAAGAAAAAPDAPAGTSGGTIAAGSQDAADSGQRHAASVQSGASTLHFAQRGAEARPLPMQVAAQPAVPPPASAAADPLAIDGDGTVSAQQRLAGELDDVLQHLMGAIDTDKDQQISSSEVEAFGEKLKLAFDAASQVQPGAAAAVGSAPAATQAGPSATNAVPAAAAAPMAAAPHRAADFSFGAGVLAGLMLRQYEGVAGGAAVHSPGSGLSVTA